jgi:4-hydroxy-tetrahydrodipicolinate synthase
MHVSASDGTMVSQILEKSALPPTVHPHLIGAIGTPLDEEENLHVEGLSRHLDEQWSHGVGGVFVAGTMGCLPLLREKTYVDLVRQSVEWCTNRGEILVGVGDTSYARTRDRIDYLNRFRVDGVVAITPYFLPFTQDELIDYFRHLADISKNPLYLYDVSVRTGIRLEIGTLETLAKHSNIRGIKYSYDPDEARELVHRIGGRWRVIVSALSQMGAFFREGIREHVDGLYALMPQWSGTIMHAGCKGDWKTVDHYAFRFQHLLSVVRSMGSYAAYTALVRMRGIPGNFAPAPLRQLDRHQIEILRNDSLIHE